MRGVFSHDTELIRQPALDHFLTLMHRCNPAGQSICLKYEARHFALLPSLVLATFDLGWTPILKRPQPSDKPARYVSDTLIGQNI